MIEEELHARVAAWAGVSDLIGERWYALEAPADTPPPYAVYRRSGTETAPTFDNKDTPRATFEIECVAGSLREAKQVAALIVAALDGWTGDRPAAIFCATLEDEEHMRDRESGLASVFLDFGVTYRK